MLLIELGNVGHGFAHVRGLRLHWLEFGGTGRPVVCIHGVTGNAWTWSGVAPRLTRAGRVIALDLRGHGDSQWSATHAYSTADNASDLATLVDHMGFREVDVIGSSWGALIGLNFAFQNPSLVRRLGLIDIEPSFEEDETDIPQRSASYASHTEIVTAERQLNPHAPEFMIQARASMGTCSGEGGRFMRKHDPFFLEQWPFRSDDWWEELRELEMPVLVVHADQSWVRREIVEKMAQEIPDSQVAYFQACGHLVPVERPEELALTLLDFLTAK